MPTWIQSIFSRRPTQAERIATALAGFRDPDASSLELLHRLITAIRPPRPNDMVAIRESYTVLLEQLESDHETCAAFRDHIARFLASCRLISFFTDSGVLPATGFFHEWWRIVGNALLPEVRDERQLKDCVHLIYDHSNDWRWMQEIPDELSIRLWTLLAPDKALIGKDWRKVFEQLLDAILLLSHRVSGLGVEAELMRATPDFDNYAPRFIALSAEAQEFVQSMRAHLDDDTLPADDGRQMQVIIDQCVEALQRIHKRALSSGTSMHLTYILTRSEQSLDRLRELIGMLSPRVEEDPPEAATTAWSKFIRSAFVAENRRNSLSWFWKKLSRLMALRVTENAAHSGEHYICETRREYSAMWRTAAGAGFIIAGMALIKVEASTLHAPPLIEAFLFSMIYGLGFVLIYLLGLTVATKQPAMTAQTLAGHLSNLKLTRPGDLERVADLAASVTRSQIAAILGNVLVALPMAVLLALALGYLDGTPAIPPEKAGNLLDTLDPLSWALPHAAIAGFFLFLSGLITGYFDNRAAYSDVGIRIARLRWLRRLCGEPYAERVGQYIHDRLGGIMGNFLFGCMLGSTGILGELLGLPLDIRHIAFSSAYLGFALVGFDFALSWKVLLLALIGIAGIGLINLAVSFSLALRTALNARNVDVPYPGALFAAVWRRLKSQPGSFLLPQSIPENDVAA